MSLRIFLIAVTLMLAAPANAEAPMFPGFGAGYIFDPLSICRGEPADDCQARSMPRPTGSGPSLVLQFDNPIRPTETTLPASIVAEKPQQTYSILDAGAKCDGVTDDSYAVQRALNAAKIVTVPAFGNYCLVNSTVKIPTGATLKANASGINFNAAANCFKSTTLSGDMFQLVGGDVTIDGVCFEHDGPNGRIIDDLGRLGHNRIRNAGFTALSSSNGDYLVYFDSSDDGIENSICNNGRSASAHTWCFVFDATDGKINIENFANGNVISAPDYPSAGPAVYIGSTDSSARNEGFHFNHNRVFSQANNNLLITALLWGEFVGNTFDQGYATQVIMAPNSNFAVTNVSFVANWFSTPVQQATGVCVKHLNTGNHPIANINFIGNTFGFCGYGVVFYAPANNISFIGNEFVSIQGSASDVNGATNVSWLGNQYSSIGGANLTLSDGATGGPFIINGEKYDPKASINIAQTTPSKFTFGSTTGKMLAGTVSATESITTCDAQSFTIAHGLAGTPQTGKTIVTVALPALSPASLSAPTAYIGAVGPSNVTVIFQCGMLKSSGNIELNLFTSL